MKKNTLQSFLTATSLFIILLSSIQSKAQTIFAITSSDALIRFDVANPKTITNIGTISGLTSGQMLVGSDFRPNTGELFALGYKSSDSTAQLYKINLTTSVASPVNGTPIKLALGTGPVGFDFNPAVDRIRVVSTNNKNYRLNPNNGAIAAVDLDLNYATGDVNFGKNPSVGTCAYTNSFIGSTATTLYDFDDSLNVLSRQVPPNNGVLVTVGNIGISQNTADASSDMDIYTMNNVNTAFICLNTGNSTSDSLYGINLSTGGLTALGMIGNGLDIKDIAIQISRQAIPAAKRLIYGLQFTAVDAVTKIPTAQNLVSFDSSDVSTIRTISAISGLKAGFYIAGMDFRPNGYKLYALATKLAGDSALLYTINTSTGAASVVNDTVFYVGLDSIRKNNIGFDFNPTVDRIRVTSTNGRNLRLNPITGKLAATDGVFIYNTGDANFGKTPRIGSAAYTNSYNGATKTRLYYIDETNQSIDTTATPNTGGIGTLRGGFMFNQADPSVDLDIYTYKNTGVNIAYLAANTGMSVIDSLYLLNLSTGATTLLGKIGSNGISLRDIAVVLDSSNFTVGIHKINEKTDHIALYPNPVNGESKLTFNVYTASTVSAAIYNLTGAKVADIMNNSSLNAGTYSYNLHADALASGTYIVVLSIDGETSSIKIIR
jgi:hypothetical protein